MKPHFYERSTIEKPHFYERSTIEKPHFYERSTTKKPHFYERSATQKPHFYERSAHLRWKSQTIRPKKPPTRMDKKSHGNDTSAFSDEGRPVIAVRLFHAI